MGKIIRGGIEYGGIPDSGKYWEGTQAQYDAITTKDPNTIYFITDSDTGNYGLNDLADVNISGTLVQECNLYYNATSGKWEKRVYLSAATSSGDTVVDIGRNNSANIYLYDQNGVAETSIYAGSLLLSNSSNKNLLNLQVNSDAYGEIRLSKYANNQVADTIAISGNSGEITSLGKITSLDKIVCTAVNTGSGDVTLSSKTAASSGTDLSLVTTGEKYSWNNRLPQVVYTNTNWTNSHSWSANLNQVFILTTESTNDLVILRIYSNGSVSFNRVSGTAITSATYSSAESRVYVTVDNKGLVATRIV